MNFVGLHNFNNGNTDLSPMVTLRFNKNFCPLVFVYKLEQKI